VRRRFLGQNEPVTTVPAGQVSAANYCGSKCYQTINMPSGTNVQSTIQQAIATGQLAPVTVSWASTSNCSGAPPSQTAAKVVQTGSIAAGTVSGVTASLATAGIAVGAATAAIPIVGAIVAPIMLILGTIFANHAKAVALQSSVLCENVPAANAALQQIQSGVVSGTISPSQAASAYAQLQAGFTAALKSDPSYKTGDALWLYDMCMQGICAQATLELQSLPASGDSVSSLLTTSTGTVSPVVLIGLGILAYMLL
jgi:hypothetical protein